jgi:tRNA nucleotidyltransferase (CCA-adding enzyme)
VAADAERLFDAIPEDVVAICRRLRERGKRGWVVGGCVRDLFRGAAADDWDIATDARPEEVVKIFERVVPTGIKHGTVTVVRRRKHYEVTTLRGEGAYSDGRRPDQGVFLDDIEADLARRDFTVNAIALEPLDRAVIDPFDGRGDLDRSVLRAVGEAAERFAEDGLRVMRAARFAATLELDVDPATLAAMALPRSLETLARVSVERVRDEWLKAMRARRPSVCFELLERTGALDVFCPELRATVGCEQASALHAFDVWGHTLATVDACPPDPVLRLAALLHDLGKPGAEDITLDGPASISMAEAVARRLKVSNDERDRIVRLVAQSDPGYAPTWSDADVRRWMRRVGPASVGDVLTLARACAVGHGLGVEVLLDLLDELTARARAQQGAALAARDLAVKGGELMAELGLQPGRVVGELLEALVERVIEDPSANERGRLIAEARRLLAERGQS